MPKLKELEESFLNLLQKEEANVSIFLINGIKLHGILDAYNDEVVMLKNSVTQMVYKHAISTIVPAKNIQLNEEK